MKLQMDVQGSELLVKEGLFADPGWPAHSLSAPGKKVTALRQPEQTLTRCTTTALSEISVLGE